MTIVATIPRSSITPPSRPHGSATDQNQKRHPRVDAPRSVQQASCAQRFRLRKGQLAAPAAPTFRRSVVAGGGATGTTGGGAAGAVTGGPRLPQAAITRAKIVNARRQRVYRMVNPTSETPLDGGVVGITADSMRRRLSRLSPKSASRQGRAGPAATEASRAHGEWQRAPVPAGSTHRSYRRCSSGGASRFVG